MALPEHTPLSDRLVFGGQLVDVSTASISYAPILIRGVIVNAGATISAAVTGSDSTVTVKKISGGTSTTLGTITIAVSGSAAGSTFQWTPSGTEAERSVLVGDTLVFDSDGASSTTSIANFSAVVRDT